ncbi:MAG: hypothetical protein ACI9JM_001463 [Halioglobus sp.]|jgi:hypothetical protein
MQPSTTFSINEPGVISEVIEGEAIILNFESGTYYSLNGSLQLLWEGITQGVNFGQLETLLTAHYPDINDNPGDQIEKAIRQLLEEQLVVVSDRGPAEPAVVASGSGQDYQPPQLQKYTDLQELLLLDPIHDVDASGQSTANG